jgi:hypothetical protein
MCDVEWVPRMNERLQALLDASYFVANDTTAMQGADDFLYLPAFQAEPDGDGATYERLSLQMIAAAACEADVGISIFASSDTAKAVRLLSLGEIAEIAATGTLTPPALRSTASAVSGAVLRLGPPPGTVISPKTARALSRFIEETYAITNVKLAMFLGMTSYRGGMLNIAPAMLAGPAAFRELLERAKWFLPSDVDLVYTPFFLNGGQFEAIPDLDALG